jgi:hypothetical protein
MVSAEEYAITTSVQANNNVRFFEVAGRRIFKLCDKDRNQIGNVAYIMLSYPVNLPIEYTKEDLDRNTKEVLKYVNTLCFNPETGTTF